MGEPERLPRKAPKKAKPLRRGTAFWLERHGQVWLVQRNAAGLLGGMRALPDDGWTARTDGDGASPAEARWQRAGTVRHSFTHFTLELDVRCASLSASAPIPDEGEWWPLAQLDGAGLPTVFAKAARLALAHRKGSFL